MSASRKGLPLVGQPTSSELLAEMPAGMAPRERADAARNRIRILAAAQRLFTEHGVSAVSMDQVAAAAGVGKGTLFRRFGDKSGLAMALLGSVEVELQQAMIAGPPPLGAGTDPRERLAAFVGAYLDLVASQLDLVWMSQTASAGARHRSGAHALWRAHLRMLMEQSGAQQAGVRAEVLLAALSAEQVRHWLEGEHRDLADLRAAMVDLAVQLASPPC